MRPSIQLRALLLGSTVAIVLLGFAGTSVAAPRCEAAPGTSGVDQYCETVPGAKGDRGSGSGPGAGGSLDRKTANSLNREGRDGRGVHALPSSGQRVRVDSGSKPSKAGAPGAEAPGTEAEDGQVQGARERAKSRSESSKSTLGALGSAIASGPSAGQSFLWVLAAAAVGMVGIAWARYRRGSKSEES